MKTFGPIALALLASPLQAQVAPPAPPAAPAPIDPARLVAAEATVARLIPSGIYLRMMREQFPAMMESMIGGMAQMRPSDLGLPPDKKSGDAPLGDAMKGSDPNFAAGMGAMTRAMADELGPLFTVLEPRMRTGMARAFARRFTLAQLTDLNTFFATSTGAAFASDYLLTFMDPEVMREMMAAMPEVMKALPAIMGKLDAAAPKPGRPGLVPE